MLANGTIKTIEDDEDIYISLTQLCEYFTKSAVNMQKEVEEVEPQHKRYAAGLLDMMHTIADEMVQLGKFEAQKRLIEGPEDLLRMIDKNPFGIVE
jgi:predicted regulator of amino acid metabolism with ACT domain